MRRDFMVKIDFAFCPKINDYIDAIKANELWLDGFLTNEDKQTFICPGDTCSAQITCANMTKSKIEMVKAPYFLFTKKSKTIHSADCNFEQKIELLKKSQQNEVKASQENGGKIIFQTSRPQNIETIKRSTSTNSLNTTNDLTSELSLNHNHKNHKITQSNYYLLSSLINKYLIALEENDTDSTKVEIVYPNKRKYTYKLSTLFKHINNINLDKVLENKTKIFYGKASISYGESSYGESSYGESSCYWINFHESFKNSNKKVSCFINAEAISNTTNYKLKKELLLDNNVGKDLYVFAMGKVKETQNQIYINLISENLDMLAVSDEKSLLE